MAVINRHNLKSGFEAACVVQLHIEQFKPMIERTCFFYLEINQSASETHASFY